VPQLDISLASVELVAATRALRVRPCTSCGSHPAGANRQAGRTALHSAMTAPVSISAWLAIGAGLPLIGSDCSAQGSGELQGKA
jgi:hypothetical protein